MRTGYTARFLNSTVHADYTEMFVAVLLSITEVAKNSVSSLNRLVLLYITLVGIGLGNSSMRLGYVTIQ
jgi:hypothetical protein